MGRIDWIGGMGGIDEIGGMGRMSGMSINYIDHSPS